MASNRLYLVDRRNKTHLLFAKSYASGWFVHHGIEKINEFIGDTECDTDAAWKDGDGPSDLCLMTELEFIKWKDGNQLLP